MHSFKDSHSTAPKKEKEKIEEEKATSRSCLGSKQL